MTFRSVNYEEEASYFLEEYRHQTGRDIGPPVPVEEIIESVSDFDILYSSADLLDDESGRIDFRQHLITVRDDESEQRQRFSLAHEAGHLRLHSEPIGPLDVPMPGLFGDTSRPHLSRRSNKMQWHEVEANRFAAGLLMPIHMLRPALDQARERQPNSSMPPEDQIKAVQAYLADMFNVSFMAMGIRLKSTGLSAEIFTPRLF